MNHSHCPTSEELSAYLVGKVPEERFQTITDHVDRCGACQAALQTLGDVEGSLLPQLRGIASHTALPADPELQRLQALAKAVAPQRAPAGDLWATLPPIPGVPKAAGPGQLGQYRLLEKIGQGGMGAVYMALHTRLEKVVAVKVLPAEHVPGPEEVARFEREMRAVGKLNHPNIVRATDAGDVAGIPYLVMDYVKGTDLLKLVKRWGRLPVADACELTRQAAAGLQHAHDNGLVHRDVKPSNLILSAEGQVKVLDLGLARFHSEPQVGHELTGQGRAMGTLDYMAPEQARDARAVDARADIYSLGCTLYHLLAGHPPFGGAEYPGVGAKLAAHFQTVPRLVREFRPDVPDALVGLVARMLAKQPADRPLTLREVAEVLVPFAAGCDLQRLLAPFTALTEIPAAQGEPLLLDTKPSAKALATTRPLEPLAAPSWRRPRSQLVLLVAGALLAAGVVIGVAQWSARNARQVASPADARDDKVQESPGAPFPDRPSRPFKSEKDVLASIREHLRNTAVEDRKFQRYFTLTHLYNNHQRVTANELRLYRAALAKLVNSLSWKKAIVVPRAIDPEQTLFSLDLRDLGWDEHQLWEKILKVYPYGLTHSRDTDDTLRTLGVDIAELAGTDLPQLRADFFIAMGSRPPLYHTLLQLPTNASELERQLKVDVPKNFLRNKAARAGLITSGVSRQNRLVERHDTVYGAYWRSYDFKHNEGTGNLLQLPLGPVFADNPHTNHAFVHDGGEIIFSLPNGLQGYLLVDGKDKRIDAGPIEVVRDVQETAGTPVIVNGLSCMACHKHGMIRFEDQVRQGSALGGNALLKVQALYRGKEEMGKLVDRDEDRFLRTLEEATVSFLKSGADQDKKIRDFPEPISAVARQYGKDLSLQDVALELGLEDPQKLKALIQANPELRKLNLDPLLNGGAISRESWSSLEFTTSRFHKAAKELRLGTPRVSF